MADWSRLVICDECGKANPADADACVSCGHPLAGLPEPEPDRSGNHATSAASGPSGAQGAPGQRYWGHGGDQAAFWRLVEALVPDAGQAATVQGELVRAILRVTGEYRRNGNVNWDIDPLYARLVDFLDTHLRDAEAFPPQALADIEADLRRIRACGRGETQVPLAEDHSRPYDRITDRVVEWCLKHPDPIPRPRDPPMVAHREGGSPMARIVRWLRILVGWAIGALGLLFTLSGLWVLVVVAFPVFRGERARNAPWWVPLLPMALCGLLAAACFLKARRILRAVASPDGAALKGPETATADVPAVSVVPTGQEAVWPEPREYVRRRLRFSVRDGVFSVQVGAKDLVRTPISNLRTLAFRVGFREGLGGSLGGFMGGFLCLTFHDPSSVGGVYGEQPALRKGMASNLRWRKCHVSIPTFTLKEVEAVRLALGIPSPVAGEPAARIEDFYRTLMAVTPRVYVTYILIGLNVAVFLAMVISGVHATRPTPLQLLAWGANYGPLTTQGQWWRLMTSVFLHFGVIHLAFNMWALLEGGVLMERLVGNAETLALYLVAGLMGSVASLYWNPTIVSAGASGAIFGLFGALLGFLAIRPRGFPIEVLRSLRNSAVFFLLANVYMGMKTPNIDMAAHVGGAVAGLVGGMVLSRPLRPARGGARLARIILLAGCGVLAAVLALRSDAHSPGLGLAKGSRYLNAGNQLGAAGRFAEACEQFAKAVEANPRLGEAHVSWGIALGSLCRYAEACDRFAKAIEIDPRCTTAWLYWGIALRDMGNPRDACEKFAKAIEINPRVAQAWFHWGVGLVNMGNPRDACEKFAKAVEVEPGGVDALVAWAGALGMTGRFEEEIEKCAKAVEIDPRCAMAYSNWGMALHELGRYEEACGRYAKAIEIHPGYAMAFYKWGLALAKMGKRAEAEEKWRKAVEINAAFWPQVEATRKQFEGTK